MQLDGRGTLVNNVTTHYINPLLADRARAPFSNASTGSRRTVTTATNPTTTPAQAVTTTQDYTDLRQISAFGSDNIYWGATDLKWAVTSWWNWYLPKVAANGTLSWTGLTADYDKTLYTSYAGIRPIIRLLPDAEMSISKN